MTEKPRILVVDDDATLLAAVERILEETYEVTVRVDASGIPALIEAGAHFDLILSDVAMHRLTGMDLHRQLHRTSPEQARRMIFMSGGFRGEPPSGHRVLAKPFTAKELRAAVQEVLRDWRRGD